MRRPRLSLDKTPLLFLLSLLAGDIVVSHVGDGGRIGLDTSDLWVVGDGREFALGSLKVGVVLDL